MDEEKVCCGCKARRPISLFKANRSRRDGLQSQCMECQAAYRRGHYLANRQKYIDKARHTKQKRAEWWIKFKETLSCAKCGESHPACIQFHHHKQDKENDVAVLAHTASMGRLMREVAKCEVLCANCHFKHHWRR